jgi:hypothetical protein
MTIVKRFGKVLGVIVGVGFLALLGAMVGPRTAHALVATLVQVVNTSAQPVLTKATDNPALKPFQVQQDQLSAFPSFTFSVPAGETLEIEQFNIDCNTSGALTQAQEPVALVRTIGGGSDASYTFAPAAAPPFNMIFNELTHIYADPGSTVTISMAGAVYPVSATPFCQLAVSGHLVTPVS